MSPNEQERLATIEAKLGSVENALDEIKQDIRAIRNVCPSCQSNIASHRAQIDQMSRDIESIYNRLWMLVGGVVLSLIGAIVNTIIKH